MIASSRMVDLVRGFRALTLAGQADDGIMRVSVGIKPLVEDLLDSHRGELLEREARVRIADLPVVHGYEALIETIYRNLLRNALDHGPAAGLRLEFTADRPDPESPWILGVRNSGCSIPASELESVFDAFRGAGRGTRNSGLGLSICMRIVERHAGRIWIESSSDAVHVGFTLGGQNDDDVASD